MVIASDLSRQNGRQWRDTATDASNNRLSEVISIATLYFFHAGSTFSGPWPVISKWQNDSWGKNNVSHPGQLHACNYRAASGC